MYFVKDNELGIIKSKNSRYFINANTELQQDGLIKKVISDIEVPSVGLATVTKGVNTDTKASYIQKMTASQVQKLTTSEVEKL